MWPFCRGTLSSNLFLTFGMLLPFISSSFIIVRRTAQRSLPVNIFTTSFIEKRQQISMIRFPSKSSIHSFAFVISNHVVSSSPQIGSVSSCRTRHKGLYASFSISSSHDTSMDIGQVRRLVQEASELAQRNIQSLSVSKTQLEVGATRM